MSVFEYQKDGKVLYGARVSLRSECQRHRAQKERRGMKSLPEAQKVEKQLIRACQLALSKKLSAQSNWGQLVADWELANLKISQFDVKNRQRQTVEDHARSLAHYTSHWWDLSADEISRADVRELFEFMDEEGKSKSRKKSIKAAINCVFDWAIESGLLLGVSQSPAKGFTFKHFEEKKPEILNINEIRKLLELAKSQDHPWYPVWAMALLTGMRSGELFALVRSDVDFENRRITVSKSYNRRIKAIKSTKSGYWREVPMNEEVFRLLKKGVFGHYKKGSDPVLPRLPHWQSGTGSQVLRAFCKGNGLPSVRFHTLRACFATQLIKDGIAPAIVMKICGWRDLKTMQRYIRLAGIEIEGATDQLKILPEDQVMGRVVDLFGGSNEGRKN